MEKRFGESYYNDADAGMDVGSDAEDTSKKSKKPKKPKFDDDIDIKDLVPDFKDDSEEERPALSSDEEHEEDAMDVDEDAPKKPKSSKKLKQEKADAKSAARRDRRLIENLVNDNLQYEAALAAKPTKTPARFRYRETSPTTFGLTARDILLADDKQLNEFAGLKKFASFRDPDKKKKDKKHLSKKARLRQWRQETFGDAEGPKGGFELLIGNEEPVAPVRHHKKRKVEETEGGIIEGEKKKKRRSRKKKSGEDEI
jgi:protein KRI1